MAHPNTGTDTPDSRSGTVTPGFRNPITPGDLPNFFACPRGCPEEPITRADDPPFGVAPPLPLGRLCALTARWKTREPNRCAAATGLQRRGVPPEPIRPSRRRTGSKIRRGRAGVHQPAQHDHRVGRQCPPASHRIGCAVTPSAERQHQPNGAFARISGRLRGDDAERRSFATAGIAQGYM